MVVNLLCRWCGQIHGPLCPHVKRIDFDEATGQTVIGVEFFSPVEMYVAGAQELRPIETDYPRKGPTR